MTLKDRIDAIDWTSLAAGLYHDGYSRMTGILSARECAGLIGGYAEDRLYRSTIEMARYRFGEGQYRYFARPLPPAVAALREGLYPGLTVLANRMMADMGRAERYPERYEDYLAQCHAAGQKRPTPLILRYGPGGYNCLHRDLYGELFFPLQATVLLSRPGADFEGGEFLLVEQRPRAQSRGEAVALQQGEMIVFPVHERPVEGARGFYRAPMRHGVSRVRAGERFALGIILHDAA